MNISVDGLKLLETVSVKRVLLVDASKVPAHLDERRREHQRQFLQQHAPNGMLRAEYWLDGGMGGVRSRPNLQLLSHDVFVASEGHVLVDLDARVELVTALRGSGVSGNALADWVVAGRGDLWGRLAGEFGAEDGVSEGTPAWKTLRQTIKMTVWLAMYGGKRLVGQEDVEAMLPRLEAKYPGLWAKGTKEAKREAARERRLQSASVWLAVALEAEKLGCRVVSFWMDEPVIECPVGIDAEVKRQLEDVAYRLLRRDHSAQA